MKQKGGNINKQEYYGSPINLGFQDLIDCESGAEFELLYSWDHSKIDASVFKSMKDINFIEEYQYFTIHKKSVNFSALTTYLENSYPFLSLPAYVYQTKTTLYILRPLYTGGEMN